ncbi:YfiR family protein [Vibrio aquaticus]|nr:YfiR family protein [Vibrio aquaticus]
MHSKSLYLKHFILAIGLCLLPPLAWSKVDEDLKAVYLFRFALLADWSGTGINSEYIEYCVTSNSEVTKRLQSIVESKSDLARFHLLLSGHSAETCHILFVEQANVGQIVQLKQQYPHALLVGDGVDFIASGGMIAFIKVRNRIRPLIARANVRQTGVRLRSQLLEVSELYNGGEV